MRVEHQLDVRADRVAHRAAGGDVALEIGAVGGHPGVELVGLVALGDALHGEVGVILRGAEAAGDVVAAHRAGVGGDAGARAAEELVGGQAGQLAREVPQGAVDRREVAVEHRARVEALDLLELVPDRLAQERVHPDDHPLGGRRRLGGAADVVAVEADAGADAGHRLRLGVRRGGVAVALVVATDVRLVLEAHRLHVGDRHAARRRPDLLRRCRQGVRHRVSTPFPISRFPAPAG